MGPISFVRSMPQRFRNRWALTRARMQLRKMNDFEALGRAAGLLLFPAVVFGCGGYLPTYSNGRIRDAISAARKEKNP